MAHLIQKRAKIEDMYRDRNLANKEIQNVSAFAKWENDTHETIKRNKMRRHEQQLAAARHASLEERRTALSEKLRAEQAMYERELREIQDTPAAQSEKVKQRALALKEKREAERKKFVEEKLYQQWRESVDPLRSADAKLCELQAVAHLDQQMLEKDEVKAEGKMHDEVYNLMMNELYEQRLEREKRELCEKMKRNEMTRACIESQVELRQAEEARQREADAIEEAEVARLCAVHLEEERTAKQRAWQAAREARAEVDKYKAQADALKAKKAREEKEMDRNLVMLALKKEKEDGIREEAAKKQAKADALAYMADQDLEKANDREWNMMMDRLQLEASEKQWAKRYEQWDKEHEARYKLLCEVYHDRNAQVELKKAQQLERMSNVDRDQAAMKAEMQRVEEQDKRREELEHAMRMEHQQQLEKQIAHRQIEQDRARQQAYTEQRQAAIVEQTFQKSLNQEHEKQKNILDQIQAARLAQQESDKGHAERAEANVRRELATRTASLAPWEK